MCYTVPIAGAVVTSLWWKKTHDLKVWWLNLMLCGGALFGFVDHLWNKELFLISDNIASDLLLGVTITAVIVALWATMVALFKTHPVLGRFLNNEA